jgi:Na+-driven multidrug efflux pump
MILVAASAANVALEVLFVYGFGWGISGSAWGTVLAQMAWSNHRLRALARP